MIQGLEKRFQYGTDTHLKFTPLPLYRNIYLFISRKRRYAVKLNLRINDSHDFIPQALYRFLSSKLQHRLELTLHRKKSLLNLRCSVFFFKVISIVFFF